MTIKLKNNQEIKNEFDQLFGQLTEQEKLENDAQLLMFQFLSIVEAKCDELGWSRKKLAEKVGTSSSYITQLFRGDKMANMLILSKFQKVLDFKFNISGKQKYEEEIKDYGPMGDGLGVWVYRKLSKPDYDSSGKLPAFDDDQSTKIA